MRPSIVNETVAVAKKFLDGELEKCDSWIQVLRNKDLNPYISDAIILRICPLLLKIIGVGKNESDAKRAFTQSKKGIGAPRSNEFIRPENGRH
jgi:hypothetical protein